jgi:hypothetical protein
MATAEGLGADWRTFCAQVYRVYGYTCWLCNRPIDPTLPKSHPMSRTVDHLDARATHGYHLPHIERVRPAHRRCNSKRGTGARRPKPVKASRDW